MDEWNPILMANCHRHCDLWTHPQLKLIDLRELHGHITDDPDQMPNLEFVLNITCICPQSCSESAPPLHLANKKSSRRVSNRVELCIIVPIIKQKAVKHYFLIPSQWLNCEKKNRGDWCCFMFMLHMQCNTVTVDINTAAKLHAPMDVTNSSKQKKPTTCRHRTGSLLPHNTLTKSQRSGQGLLLYESV